MKTIIETGCGWVYAVIILSILMMLSKTIQWILSKIFPFEDCNQYTKDGRAAKAAFSNMCKLESDMQSTLYDGY